MKESATARNPCWLRLQLLALLGFVSLMAMSFCSGPPMPSEPPGQNLDAPPARPLAELEAELQSTEPAVRGNAVLEILRGEYREATPKLLTLLEKDPAANVRQTAALALGSMQERRAGPIIVRMLRNDRAIDRGFLVEALVRLGDRSNAAALTPLLNDSDEQLRLKAVDALVQLDARDQGGAILALAQANRDPSRETQFATALGRLRVRAAEGYLLNLARRSEAGPTLASAYLSLGEIGSRQATPLLVQAIQSDFDKGRENAIAALIETQDPAANDGLFPLLKNERSEVRFGAARVIADIRDARAGPRALALLKEVGALSTGPAAYILGRQKYAPARETVQALLAEKRSPSREELARTLGWIGDRRSIPLLINTLQESDGEGRYGAAWSLGVLEAREASAALRRTAQSDDRKLAILSIEALAAVRDPESLEDLRSLIRSRRDLAFQAVDAVGLIPGERARQILIEVLQSRDDELKIAAARALGRRKETQAIAPLIELLDEDAAELRDAAMAALREISGERFRNEAQWRHWAATR